MDTWSFSYSTETLKRAFALWELYDFRSVPNVQQVLSTSIDDLQDLKMVYDICRIYKLKNDSE